MKSEDIQSLLSEKLDKKRYQHTLGVAFTASALAMCYGMDMEQAYLAGLLHDCAKSMNADELIKSCKKYNLEVSEIEKKNTALLHAKVGSVLAKEQYGITDTAIQSAIFYHTTGHPKMSELEKIIFISDYIEPLRNHDTDLKKIRTTAFHDLDLCLCYILRNTVEYLQTSGKAIDTMTELTYEYYKDKEVKYESNIN